MAFLPVTAEEISERGWEQPDFILIWGDAYVDHPSFCGAIISRQLEAFGYKVAIINQPDWKDEEDFKKLGEPRLAFLVTSGNIDSMVNHYSVSKKHRRKDSYTDNGEMGKRPDRALIVYTQMIKRLFPHKPIVVGGIEASLRRFSHYDYWDDKVRASILIDSQADLLLYGMGERSIVEIADALDSGLDVHDITFIRGTAYLTKNIDYVSDYIELPSFAEVKSDKRKYCESFRIQNQNRDALNASTLVEKYDGWHLVQNPPQLPLSTQEMDDAYGLPYEYAIHPMYHHIPAFDEVQFSIVSNRGCFGSCTFCAITAHQGRMITHRSKESIVAEAKRMSEDKDFKGYIHDVGGPTANFHDVSCEEQLERGTCKMKECMYPEPCRNLIVSHTDYLEVLRELRGLPKVKKVFIRSGIRYDYLMADKDEAFFNELVQHHISGQLKVAPEHIHAEVLSHMHKPRMEVYNKFVKKYEEKNKEFHKDQYLVPYLISSHPGSDLNAAIDLAVYLKMNHINPEQVQDFYPTPATAATCMYYTGIDPFTMKEVYVARNPHEKAMQRALLQTKDPKNYDLIKEALEKTGRTDLIGSGPGCLIPEDKKQLMYNRKRGRRYDYSI